MFPGFATRTRARRHTPPNQVRYPTDRQFASGYSPPRLTTTQLPSATELWLTPTGTCTLQMARPRGRTPSPCKGEGMLFCVYDTVRIAVLQSGSGEILFSNSPASPLAGWKRAFAGKIDVGCNTCPQEVFIGRAYCYAYADGNFCAVVNFFRSKSNVGFVKIELHSLCF